MQQLVNYLYIYFNKRVHKLYYARNNHPTIISSYAVIEEEKRNSELENLEGEFPPKSLPSIVEKNVC